MKTLLAIIGIFCLFSFAQANPAANELHRMQQQQHIWATQRHQQAQRNQAYQQGLRNAQQRANRVYTGQPPIIGTQPRGNLYGY